MTWTSSMLHRWGFQSTCVRRVWPYQRGPMRADFVAKLGGTRLARNNRIVGKEFLNRCCSLGAVLESMLPAQAPKIVLQHYLPEADMARTDFGRWVNCSLLNQKRGA